MFLRKLLIILLIFQPFVEKMTKKMGLGFDVFNELISIGVLMAYLFVMYKTKKAHNLTILAVAFIGYLILLGLLRQIVPLTVLQIVMYSQFFFYFFYFFSLSPEEKKQTFIALKKIFDYVVIIIAIIALIEVVDHSTWRSFLGVHSVKRGINYFYLISFFGSGPSLAIFTSLYVFVWHYYHYVLGSKKVTKDKFLLVLAIGLGVLSFSRKEVLFVFLFLIFFPYPSRSNLNKWAKRAIFLVGAFVSLVVYYLSFFADANSVAFDQNYIRWKIVSKSLEVFGDYAPFGTGAGTFGSRVSLMMPHIYDQYNIGEDMLGYKVLGNTGPIYDAFMFTFLTEIGIGILIFLFFFYKLLEARTHFKTAYSVFVKNYLIVYFLLLSLFVPMVTNNFGFIIFILLGLMISQVSLLTFRRWYAKD